MAHLPVYEAALGLTTNEDVAADFLATLSPTNRSSGFYVDWSKARSSVRQQQVRLNILNTLTDCRTAQEAEDQFPPLLREYPEIAEVLPLLLATRLKRGERALPVVNDFDDALPPTVHVRFDPAVATDAASVRTLVGFLRGSGVFALLADPHIHDLVEYVFGVEVGLDTNARKNRSGTAMEQLVDPIITGATMLLPGTSVYRQFGAGLAKTLGLPWPFDRARAADFAVLTASADGARLWVETNYFQVSGSKASVAGDYIRRARDLQRAGWDFALVTDGPGWRKMGSEVREMVAELGYLMNLDQVRRGLLQAILAALFS